MEQRKFIFRERENKERDMRREAVTVAERKLTASQTWTQVFFSENVCCPFCNMVL